MKDHDFSSSCEHIHLFWRHQLEYPHAKPIIAHHRWRTGMTDLLLAPFKWALRWRI